MSTIKLFETKQVRSLWDQEKETWFFSIVDVVAVLTDSPKPRTYWSVLKTRLKKEGSELATNCSQLKMESADGKNYLTDVANTEQLLRLVQSIPSPKAEPVWHLYVVQHPQRDALHKALANAGIGTLIHYPIPPHLQGAYAALGFSKGAFPLAEQIANHCISLPMGPHLHEAGASSVIAALKLSLIHI